MPQLINLSFSDGVFTRTSRELYTPEKHGGIVIIHALHWHGRNALLEEISRATTAFRKAPTYEGPVMQDMFTFYCGEADYPRTQGEFSVIKRLRSEYLHWEQKLGESANFTSEINSIGIHHYPANSGGISPHQDYASDKNLISIFVLKGNDPLYLCRDRNKTDTLPLNASPGDLILLRAPRNNAENSLRPFHYLEKLIEERITLIFRQRQKLGTKVPRVSASF